MSPLLELSVSLMVYIVFFISRRQSAW